MTPALVASRPDVHWSIHAACPAEWQQHLAQCGGGYFHCSRGLLVCAPVGEPIFCELRGGNAVMGIATGVRHACDGNPSLRHAYFPTVPALACRWKREAALTALADALQECGVEDVMFDSFDARWIPGSAASTVDVKRRREYTVALYEPMRQIIERFTPHCRRLLQEGDEAGLTCRTLASAKTGPLLRALRSEARADGADADAGTTEWARVPVPATTSLGEAIGTATFAAYDRHEVRAVALVGWANRRAYFLAGGSAPEGEETMVNSWLHGRIMSALVAHGFLAYTLGGTAADAVNPGHPANGEHRLRMGFAPEVTELFGVRWNLASGHYRATGSHAPFAGSIGV